MPPRGYPVLGQSRVEWLELSTREDGQITPAAQKSVSQWQEAGLAVRSKVVNGPSFWQTAEIEDAPALLEASIAAVCQTPAAGAVT